MATYLAGSAYLQIVPSLRGFRKELRTELAKVNVEFKVTATPKLDLTAARAAADLAEKTMKRDITWNVKLDVGGAMAKLTALTLAANRVGAGSVGIAALTHAVTGITAAVIPAVGALGLLPAAGFAAAAGIGALAIGFEGMGDAIKNSGDPKKFAESLKQLAPAARETAIAIKSLGPAAEDMRRAVQQQLFAGMAVEIKLLAKNYLPLLKTQLAGITAEANRSAKGVFAALNQKATIADVRTGLGDVRSAFGELGAAAQPAVLALRDIGVVGTSFLPNLAASVATGARAFADLVAQMRVSGQLQQVISNGLSTLGQLGSIIANIASAIGAVFSAASAAGTSMLTVLDQGTQAMATWARSAEGTATLTTVFSTLKTVVDILMPLLSAVGQVFTQTILPAAAVLLPSLAAGFAALQPAVQPVGAALVAVAQAVAPVIIDLAHLAGIVLPGLAAGLRFLAPILPVLAAMAVGAWAVVAATNAWAAAQTLLNLIIKANPLIRLAVIIGAVVAAVLAAWQYFEPFRTAVVTALEAIGAAGVWLWENALKPAFDALSVAVRFVAGVIVTALVAPVVMAFNALASVATWLWDTILQPIFSVLGTVASALWTGILQPVLDGFIGTLKVLGEIASWLWDTILSPVFSFIGAGFSLLGSIISTVYNGVIKPVWDGLGSAIRWVWENVLRPVFDAIKGGVDLVGKAFDSAVQFIGRVWDGIKAIAAKPVNFVIDYVYNKGIRAVWNWVADFLGLGKLNEAKLIEFSGGGVLGGYAPGRDTVPALLSPGEAVLVPELVRAIGPTNILAANAAASGRPGTVAGPGFSGGGLARFAGGGVVDSLLGFIPNLAGDIAALWRDPIGIIKRKLDGNSGWIDMVARAPSKLIGDAASWLWQKLTESFSIAGSISSAVDAAAGAMRGQLGEWIQAGIAWTGVGPEWAAPLRTLIMRESGGNPRAINLWDSNAKRGTPSGGLMQTIGPTFAANRDPRLPNDMFHPIANIVAGINYIRRRYGTIFNVQQANPNAAPRGYDSGGWLMPGLQAVYNGTGRPEAVLTSQQWELMAAGAEQPRELVGALYLDSGEFLGRVRGEVIAVQNETGSAIARGRRA